MPRTLALAVLDAVLAKRRPFDESFDKHPRTATLSTRDRAFAYTLIAATLRRLGQIDAAIDACLQTPLTPRARGAREVLRLGAAQLLFLGTPAHAAVDTSVGLAAADPRFARYKNLVNAVLHKLARDGAGIVAGQDAALLNTPDWLWRSWTDAYGKATARAIAEAHLDQPPIDLAVKADAAGWAARLSAQLTPTGALRLQPGAAIASLPGYDEGAWWVQDEAAQLPARLLGDVRGQRVGDIGAAPGGKTAQLAARGAHVVAVDRSRPRLRLLTANLARLKLAAEVVEADARVWRPMEPLDAALLDAPCSATGTIRRHPDILRIRRPAEVASAVALQIELLTATLDMVRSGGTVVFATCSLQPEEGPAIVRQILAARPDVKRWPISPADIGGEANLVANLLTVDADLRTLPSHGMDGFYAARLVKT